MEVWKQQLNDALNDVAIYAGDWDAALEMVASAPETPELNEYLTYLVPRLKRHQRQFNWVTYDNKERTYTIHNFDYKMYQYMSRRYKDEAIITSESISIRAEALTDDDCDKLREQC